MTKDHIVAEIRRTAAQNAGKPLGRQRFLAETGIRESDWAGKYWIRWREALAEAGFGPNQLQSAFPDADLLAPLAALAKELGRFPVRAEIKIRRRTDPSFPSVNTFNRFGGQKALAARLREFCLARGEEGLASLCFPTLESSPDTERAPEPAKDSEPGFVYLMKSGRFYKIGRSNAVGRRERELAIQLPEKAKVVHSIRTDDPIGIEEYWHKRFDERRKNGEWFELTAQDVSAFRRRKFM